MSATRMIAATGRDKKATIIRTSLLIITLAFILLNFSAGIAQAEPTPPNPVQIPSVNFQINGAEPGDNPQNLSTVLNIIIILTVLTMAPAFLLMMTSFPRIIVVLSFLRNSLATQQMPPNQILLGLALFLTLFIMMPTWRDVNQAAITPYMNGEIDQSQAYARGMQPIRAFMFKQTRENDLALFIRMADLPRPGNFDDIPNRVLIPAYVISELKTAFQIGFVIYIPFLVIDMIVASALMSMGMMMLPPMMISLPFKILLFVLVDGWNLVMQALVMSFL